MNQHSTPTFQKPSPGRRLITLLLSAGTAAVVLGSSIPTDAWAADETRAVSGDVRWTGPATEVTSKIVGSGSLKRL